MSKKTISQMEVTLLDRIEKAKAKLEQVQQRHKLEIGNLAYKHCLETYDLETLDLLFARLAGKVTVDEL